MMTGLKDISAVGPPDDSNGSSTLFDEDRDREENEAFERMPSDTERWASRWTFSCSRRV